MAWFYDANTTGGLELPTPSIMTVLGGAFVGPASLPAELFQPEFYEKVLGTQEHLVTWGTRMASVQYKYSAAHYASAYNLCLTDISY
ncbi:MAG: hypothetical protein ACI8UP_005294 [Porticoccaceae bacterium]